VPKPVVVLYVINSIHRDRGSAVVKVLCYKSEGHWFDPIDIKSLQWHYGPGVDSVSNRNEYQEYFLGVKAAGPYG